MNYFDVYINSGEIYLDIFIDDENIGKDATKKLIGIMQKFVEKSDFNSIRKFILINDYKLLKKLDEINGAVLVSLFEKLKTNEFIQLISKEDIVKRLSNQKEFFIKKDEIETNFQKYILDRILKLNKDMFYSYLKTLNDEFTNKLLITYDGFLKKIKDFNKKEEIDLLIDYIFKIDSLYYKKRDKLYSYLVNNDTIKYIILFSSISSLMAIMRTYVHVDEKLLDEIIKKHCCEFVEKIKNINIDEKDRIDVVILSKLFDCLLKNNKKKLLTVLPLFKFILKDDMEYFKNLLNGECDKINVNNHHKYEKVVNKYNLTDECRSMMLGVEIDTLLDI